MPNDHGIPDSLKELQSVAFDLLPATILSTTFPTVPVPPGMTLAAFGTRAYVRSGTDLVYVAQDPQPVTLTGADGTYWLAASTDTFADFAQWTRQAGTAYLTRPSSTQPADVDGLLVFCQLTVAGGAITAVAPIASRSTLAAAWRGLLALGTLAQQNADAVAITGGTATGLSSLGVTGNASFSNQVGIGSPSNPLYSLDVQFASRFHSDATIDGTVIGNTGLFNGSVGFGGAPDSNYSLRAYFNSRFDQQLGVGGIAPSYTLHVNGNAGIPGGAWINSTSSARLKQDIQECTHALATLLRLRERTWEWDTTAPHLAQQMPGRQAGFVLEEVAETHPGWVSIAEDGRAGLCLRGIEAYIVGALRELTQRLEVLEAAATRGVAPAPG